MDDLSRLSKEELQAILDETEQHIADIRSELKHREEREQHQAVDALELHLERSKVNWGEVKAFFQQVLAELRSGSR